MLANSLNRPSHRARAMRRVSCLVATAALVSLAAPRLQATSAAPRPQAGGATPRAQVTGAALHVQAASATPYDWPQFDGDARHGGNNTAESLINASNVNTLQLKFRVTLPAVADSAPAYLSAVTTPQGTKDLLFVTTKDGRILALDAHSGATVWSHQYGPGSCTINRGSAPCYTTSSPAMDPGRQHVFAYGLDGYVHQYQVGDGTEVTGGGWPELATLKDFDEKGSSALTVAVTGSVTYLYVTNGGYPGDQGDYQGHVTAINLATGAQRVFNMLCSAAGNVHFVEKPGHPDCPQVQSAVWARSGVVYDAETGRLYAATGNGLYAPGRKDWGDSVVALNPDASGLNGGPLDSYTPRDFQHLQQTDEDLGSTAPALLLVPASSNVKHLALQSGKDALIRLLNLDNLSGQGGPGHVGGQVGPLRRVPQGGEVLTAPAVWVDPNSQTTWTFIANDNGISGLQVTVSITGLPGLKTIWQSSAGGSSPLVANNVLYYAGSGSIHALDPRTGHALWGDSSIGGIHWESPIVDNGYLYITDESGALSAYTLPGMS